jgi:hypothetical protein
MTETTNMDFAIYGREEDAGPHRVSERALYYREGGLVVRALVVVSHKLRPDFRPYPSQGGKRWA